MAIITTPQEAKDTPHTAGTMFRCADCGQVKPVHTDGGTGYATAPNDKPNGLICYECCAIRDRAEMKQRGIATLYYTREIGKGEQIGNWPGTLTFRVLTSRRFNHPFASEAYLGEFLGPDGELWRFRNIGDNQIAHCRRAKR
jgi:hypothetical protein